MFKPIQALLYLYFGLLLFSCAAPTSNTNTLTQSKHKELDILIENVNYIKDYNSDSSYVILYKSIERQSGELLNFFVLNSNSREKVFSSNKEYVKVNWSDTYVLQLIKNPLPDIKPNQTENKPSKIQFYNIKQKSFLNPN